MSKLKRIVWLTMAIALLSLTACGGGTASSPTVDPGAVYTAAVETAYAQLTETAMVVTDTPAAPAGPTVTPSITNTPLITNTPSTAIPTFTPFSLTPIGPTQASCDNFLFIGDVTIPDGSEMAPGEKFTKTWEIQNLGPCPWNTDYRVTYGWGDPMGNNYNFFDIFAAEVLPGDVVEVSIDLTAPTEPGSYNSAWRMQTPTSANFGIALTVVIKVP
jgi:hypothetical protein